MSENNGDPFAEAARQFTQGQNQFQKMWTDFASKMGMAGVSFSPDTTPPDAARAMRSTFFKAWSEYCEQYMRSPEFLDSWKKAMDGAIQFRRQMNQSLGQMHHDFGGTSRQDVDHLMQSMTHLERRLVDSQERAAASVEKMAKSIAALEEKLAAAEKNRAAAPAAKSKRTPKRKAVKKTAAKKKTAKKKAPKKKVSKKRT